MGLEEERKKVTFCVENLTRFLYAQILPDVSFERIRELKDKILKIPDLNYTLERYHDTREDALNRGIRQGLAMRAIFQKENCTESERRMVMGFFPEITAAVLQYDFFMPAFNLQASEEQKAQYKEKLDNLEIIGCYAQTELGHGSNVRGIETQAIYDNQRDEFIMNSPTVTSHKWWIGGLGVSCSHALVVAKLIMNQQDMGPHTFFVPIRDMRTHEPLPGITVGDIGPKMGNPCADNGFLRFDNYRVPKSVMLTRFARINDKGEYEILDPNALKVLYSSLVRARVNLSRDAWHYPTIAATIAIRYSLVREQFPDPENPQRERKLLDYQIQRSKLFTVLAKIYAIVFVRAVLTEKYNESERRMKNMDGSLLGELHALSSLCKGFITASAIECIEVCRRCCGGHGYSMYSGIPHLYASYLPSATYDGDNSILILQSARYMTNIIKKIHKGEPIPDKYVFLANPIPHLSGDQNPASPSFHQACFQAISYVSLNNLAKREAQFLKNGMKKEKIWTEILQIEGIEAAETFFHTSVHEDFIKGLSLITDPNAKQAIEYLRQIYAITQLDKYAGILINLGASPNVIDKMKDVLLEAFDKTRDNAIGLIEAFEKPDEMLCSVLGKRDGNVYESMLFAAKHLNPINKSSVYPGIQKYLRPKL
ncbi:unnamed protein product [Blepharisma stoltei]|uniref:Acyl-coenzyme A oxidase n=1 Tax=Blepharisma stoltei TaxID=1481888 RepID=A0AAU9JCG2_9CILI|nr:unnamed protein product [Blepharisma stoltei]